MNKNSGDHFVTCGTMKLLEKRADETGYSYYDMMESAGRGAAAEIMKQTKPCSAVILCGKGNNGGDGFVVARLLAEAGYQITVILVEGEPATPDAKTNFDLIKNMCLKTIDLSGQGNLVNVGKTPDIIVDAIYGTGFHGLLKGNSLTAAMYCNKYSEMGVPVFSLDIPSGMSGDALSEEDIDNRCIRAAVTLPFHARKPVHMQAFAQENCGKIIVVDIGLDEERLLDFSSVKADRVQVDEPVYRPTELKQFSQKTLDEITRFIEDAESRDYSFDDFVGIIAKLRDPDGGCPWDRAQTHESLKPCFVEEVNEALDAIDNRDMDNLCEELGDVLLQIVLHAQIASEAGHFSMQDVVQCAAQKMVRRHPHVFGSIDMNEVDDGLDIWEEIKRREKAAKAAKATKTAKKV